MKQSKLIEHVENQNGCLDKKPFAFKQFIFAEIILSEEFHTKVHSTANCTSLLGALFIFERRMSDMRCCACNKFRPNTNFVNSWKSL